MLTTTHCSAFPSHRLNVEYSKDKNGKWIVWPIDQPPPSSAEEVAKRRKAVVKKGQLSWAEVAGTLIGWIKQQMYRDGNLQYGWKVVKFVADADESSYDPRHPEENGSSPCPASVDGSHVHTVGGGEDSRALSMHVTWLKSKPRGRGTTAVAVEGAAGGSDWMLVGRDNGPPLAYGPL